MSNSAGPKITKDGLVLDFDAANIKSYNFYADPYASSVILYLQMNGTNSSTTFIDSSTNAWTVTAVGNTQISTAQSKYNGSSAYFDGTGDYLSIPDSDIFHISSDFTFESWIWIDGGTNAIQSIYSQRQSGSLGFQCTITYNAGVYQQWLWIDSTHVVTYQSGISIPTGQWVHLAWTRSGSSVKTFVNGVLNHSVTYTGSPINESAPVIIGDAPGYTQGFKGYIDELKFTKGIAKYTATFTSPPIPSTCTDLTRSKNVGTLTGGVDYNFSNGGSLVFATSYISSPSANAYQLGVNDFTFESWIYLNAYPLNNNGYYTSMIMCKDQLGSRGFNFSIIGSSSANTTLLFGGFSSNSVAQSVSPSYPFQLNTWYHVAASRIGNLLYLYVNGNLLNAGGTSFTTTIQSTTSEVRIGAQVYTGGYNYYVNGRIAIMKLYNGRGLTSTEVYNNFAANRGRFGV